MYKDYVARKQNHIFKLPAPLKGISRPDIDYDVVFWDVRLRKNFSFKSWRILF
jgi:hypothetical protein